MTIPAVAGRIPRLAHIERQDFRQNYWPDLYELGEHVVFYEPTGQGKTHLAWQLLDVTLDEFPAARFASLMPKPRDKPTTDWARQLDLKLTDIWPPAARFPGQHKPRGHVVWPRHIKSDIALNRAHLARVFRATLRDQYWKGNSITFADDLYKLAVILGLNMDLEEHWTSGQAMGAGLWSAGQKASGTLSGSISTFSYNSAAHLFLGKDPDVRNQRRIGEIGGVDPQIVTAIVATLPIHKVMVAGRVKNISEKLYICKRGYMAIIGL